MSFRKTPPILLGNVIGSDHGESRMSWIGRVINTIRNGLFGVIFVMSKSDAVRLPQLGLQC